MPLRYCFQLLLLAALLGGEGPHAANEKTVTVASGVFWSRAISPTLPEYPGAMVESKTQGVVVVKVLVGVDGSVLAADVLESPHPLLARVVIESVKLWRFQPFQSAERKETFRCESRLAFYFRIQDGKPVVIDAAAAQWQADVEASRKKK